MQSLWLLAILGFVLALFYSRRVQRAAFDALDRAQQQRLLEAADPSRGMLSLFVVLAAILVYVTARTRWPDSPLPAAVFVVALCGFYGLEATRQLRLIKKLELPEAYYRAVRGGRLVQALALAVLVVVMLTRLGAGIV